MSKLAQEETRLLTAAAATAQPRKNVSCCLKTAIKTKKAKNFVQMFLFFFSFGASSFIASSFGEWRAYMKKMLASQSFFILFCF